VHVTYVLYGVWVYDKWNLFSSFLFDYTLIKILDREVFIYLFIYLKIRLLIVLLHKMILKADI
jgi:hypothetical protein